MKKKPPERIDHPAVTWGPELFEARGPGQPEIDDDAILEQMRRLAPEIPDAGAAKLCHLITGKGYDHKDVLRIAKKFRRNPPMQK